MEDDAARQPASTLEVGDHTPEPEPPQDDTPTGWRRLIPRGGRFFCLSTEHPTYPQEWLTEYKARERRRLRADPQCQAAVIELQRLWSSVERILQADPTLDAWLNQCTLLRWVLDHETDKLPISDRATRRGYLAEQAFPPGLAHLLTDPADSPIEVIVNADTIPLSLSLAPGEIVIRLSDTPVGRISRHFLRFVTEAQQTFLGRAPKRGRPADTLTNQRVAALRATQDLTARQIDKLTGLASPKHKDSPRAKRRRVAYRSRRGSQPNERELGPAWEEKVRGWWQAAPGRADAAPEKDDGDK